MKAIVIENREGRQNVTMAELPPPTISHPDEVLIKVLCVGLDGTDREIITEKYGRLPDGKSRMVIGHEVMGVVEEAGVETGFQCGDLVTILVRRPCQDDRCVNCQMGHQDFCMTGTYVERGINGADGYLCELVVEHAQYVVKLPADALSFGVLVEPQSIVEKVWNQVLVIQQRMIWQPKHVLILGSGPLGILTALTCRLLGMDTYVWSHSHTLSVNAEIIRKSGGHFQQADAFANISDTELEIASGDTFFSKLTDYVTHLNIGFDMIWECSGHTPLGFEAMALLNNNGVLALLGVTAGNRRLEIPCDLLNQEIVLKNKCIIGSVNASRHDFETGIERLQNMEKRFPGILNEIISDRLEIEDVTAIDFKQINIKAVVDLVSQDKWNSVDPAPPA